MFKALKGQCKEKSMVFTISGVASDMYKGPFNRVSIKILLVSMSFVFFSALYDSAPSRTASGAMHYSKNIQIPA